MCQGCKGHGLLSKADVAEPKLGLLTTQEASQSRGKFLRQGRATLFRKAANRDDGGLVSQRAIFPKLAFRLFLREEGVLVAADFFMLESFVLAAVHTGQVKMCL